MEFVNGSDLPKSLISPTPSVSNIHALTKGGYGPRTFCRASSSRTITAATGACRHSAGKWMKWLGEDVGHQCQEGAFLCFSLRKEEKGDKMGGERRRREDGWKEGNILSFFSPSPYIYLAIPHIPSYTEPA